MTGLRPAAAAATSLAVAVGLAVVGAGPAGAAAASSSTSLVLSAPDSVWGQTVRASAAVATTGGAAEGDVLFDVDGTTVKANLTGAGTAAVVLPRLPVGTHAVTATFVPQSSATQTGSSSPTVAWTVAPAPTHLQADVRRARPGARASARVQVDGEYGTHPAGRVRLVLRRDGRVVRRTTVTLGGASVATAPLGRVRRGLHRLKVTYLGDPQHLRHRRVVRFRVGR